MRWIIGIDEAGYGPNLGPLVMTSVTCGVPESRERQDLWKLLQAAVRRPTEPADSRLVIGDSKLVYTPARGLADLETGVLAIAGPFTFGGTVDALLSGICADSLPELRTEPWYTGATQVPFVADASWCCQQRKRLGDECGVQGVSWGPVIGAVVCPVRFNRCIEKWGSKAAALAEALTCLLRENLVRLAKVDQIDIVIDKHGGRNSYAAMLQHALPQGTVLAREEKRDRSVYEILGLSAAVRVVFQPRADSEHFCVALASMVSKYVRELTMVEFNAYWRRHLPNLKPTAGYPVDALRFMAEIRPLLAGLGIAEGTLWRQR